MALVNPTQPTLPAGSNQQVQFNNSGVFGASGDLTWDGTALNVGSTLTATAQSKLIVKDEALEVRGRFSETLTAIVARLGVGPNGDSSRILFGETGGVNWQIDNNAGTFRWFTPGVLQMTLTTTVFNLVNNKSMIGISSITGNGQLTMAALAATVTSTAVDITLTGLQHTILVDTSAATRNISLPLASAAAGRFYEIKKMSALNTLNVLRSASDTLYTTSSGNTSYAQLTDGSVSRWVADPPNNRWCLLS